jgi:YVTN family beta-propeller protein
VSIHSKEDSNMVYVTRAGGDFVTVINSSTQGAFANITVGSFPMRVAVDSSVNMIYVTKSCSNSTSVSEVEFVEVIPVMLQS